MPMHTMDEQAPALTPAMLMGAIRQIVAERGASGGTSMAVVLIAERVLTGRTFASPSERARARLAVAHEIAQLAPQVEGLGYVENE